MEKKKDWLTWKKKKKKKKEDWLTYITIEIY